MVEQKNKINNGAFKKGVPSWNKGLNMPWVQEKNHYKWTGGNRHTVRTMVKRLGIDRTYCRICKEKKKTLVHHIDGNILNNNPRNWAIVCFFCHNAIHKNGFKKGHKLPRESIERIRKANIGNSAWNKGMKVNKADYPTMGHFQKHTDESKQKMRLKKLGKKVSEETKLKMSIAQNNRYLNKQIIT